MYAISTRIGQSTECWGGIEQFTNFSMTWLQWDTFLKILVTGLTFYRKMGEREIGARRGLRTTWRGMETAIKSSKRSHNENMCSSSNQIQAFSTVAFCSHCSYKRPSHISFSSLLTLYSCLDSLSPHHSFDSFWFQLMCTVSTFCCPNKFCVLEVLVRPVITIKLFKTFLLILVNIF